MIGEEVLFSSIREIGAHLRARRISAVDLAEMSLRRLETIGPRLGAVVTVTRERALAQAHRANQELLAGKDRGPLHGIPYGAKDLLATKGIPTTWGAEPLRGQVFDFDATVVRRLEEAGAVLVAKLAMVELAGGLGYNNPDASFTGPGRTPWNPDYWSGGSSSGPGGGGGGGPGALRDRQRDVRLDPHPRGLLRRDRPAAHLRPRLPPRRDGAVLDARQARPPRAGRGRLRPRARRHRRSGPRGPDHGRELPLPGARRRRAAGPASASASASCATRPRAATRTSSRASGRRVSALRDVADVEEDVPFPDLPYREAVGLIVDAEGAAAFRDLIESGKVKQLRDAADRVGGYAMIMTRAADYLDAMRSRVAMRAQLDALLSRYDALVAPTRTRLAPPIGRDFDAPTPGTPPAPEPAPARARPPATIPAGNLAGLPAIAVPMGFGKDRLPTSLQLLGRAFSEETLVALAAAYQEMTDWHRQRPPVL